MSNIYSMPLIIRRGGTKVKNLGLQDYLVVMDSTGVFEDTNVYIDFGQGAEPFSAFFQGVFYLGGKNVELKNTKSSNVEHWGIPLNNTLGFTPVSSNDSFKYAIIRILPRNGFAADLNLFANDLADSKGFKSFQSGSFPSTATTVEASVYPFVYERKTSGSTKQQKLTTYSVQDPNSSTNRQRTGTELLKLGFGPSNWAIYASNTTFNYQDYANKLISHLGSYAQQIIGSTMEFGFLAILRGSLPNNWTPRRHILWFLQRCTDIDTTNDWTHIQLT